MSRTVEILGLVLCGLCLTGAVGLAEGEAVGGDPVEFAVSVEGSYTDNRDAVPTDEQDNFDVIATPRADVFADWERTILDFYYAPAFRYRTDPADSQDEAEWFHAVGVNLDHRAAPRLKFKLSDRFDYNEDPAVEDGGTRVGPERLFFLNQANATVIGELTRQSLLEVYGWQKTKRYEDNEVADILDEDRTDAGLKLWRRLHRTQAVFLEGRGSMYGYENPNGVQRDFDLFYTGVGIENTFSQNLRGLLAGGWQWQEYDDPGLNKQDSPYVQGSLEGNLTPATRMVAAVTHGIRDSDAFPYASQEYNEYYLKGEWDATAAVTLGLWGKIRNGNYDDSAPTTAVSDVALPGGDEDAVVAAAEAGYKLNEQTGVRLVQHYEDVDSDVSVPFTRNTTSLILSRHF
jgi:hypothetical protein